MGLGRGVQWAMVKSNHVIGLLAFEKLSYVMHLELAVEKDY